MARKSSTNQFLLDRGLPDRRNAMFSEPPFMTEEGMVLIDRRDNIERRGSGALDSGHSDWFDATAHTKAV
jgi:hypothetical protein